MLVIKGCYFKGVCIQTSNELTTIQAIYLTRSSNDNIYKVNDGCL